MDRAGLLLKLKFRSDPKMLCVVRAALGQLLETLGFVPEECRAVVLAVDEALTNVIRHAYHGQTNRPIEVSFSRIRANGNDGQRDALEIVLTDRGVLVKSEEMRGRSLDEVKPGGLGLHFIRECMDSVEFRPSKGKNHLHLVKFLRPIETIQQS